jgi:aquaporin Z
VTNLSVNPARSTGPAVFVGGWALAQLALFWVAPILGGVAAGGFSRFLFAEEETMSETVAKKSRELEEKSKKVA